MSEKGDKSRENIVDAAYALFKKKGFAATSINDLMAASGLKKGTIYFHFSGKEEIALLVLQRAREQLMEFLETVTTGATPADALENYFAGTIALHHSHEFIGGCIFGNAALEMADSNELLARFINQVFRDWTMKLRQIIAEGQGAGQVRDDLAADALAQQLVTATEGAIMLARLRKNDAPLRTCFDTFRALLALPQATNNIE
ncbi:helix-turn-helix transcriptional regulator, TetR family [Geotalea daltonii FRC-32]|uniref:Helix-turn-helix transcriptional regulator, TetR family n=1 Tax=Geotalea daltonii (strain DSM 22248 / JCM 15807 / FRC-32) TaxID=316067 RepID=B9M414_GEODF|nr:TetR/AcrR family transcriptional regulator [Geotalea daltonii]ACM19657.1 helix-turn-helix transcriptional regulator, TetR family [Geotalea daltonii FRC-32]